MCHCCQFTSRVLLSVSLLSNDSDDDSDNDTEDNDNSSCCDESNFNYVNDNSAVDND